MPRMKYIHKSRRRIRKQSCHTLRATTASLGPYANHRYYPHHTMLIFKGHPPLKTALAVKNSSKLFALPLSLTWRSTTRKRDRVSATCTLTRTLWKCRDAAICVEPARWMWSFPSCANSSVCHKARHASMQIPRKRSCKLIYEKWLPQRQSCRWGRRRKRSK